MTTKYSDFKMEPTLSEIVVDVASEQYGDEFRAKSRAGHEALVAWLIVRADADTVDDVLAENGFDSIDDLVEYLAEGRFENDDQFDPLAAVDTPRTLP